MERKRDNVLLLSYEQTISFAAHQLSQCGALISASNQDSECERAIVKNLRTTLKLMRPMSLVGQEDAARALDKLEPLRLGAKAREGARARRSSGGEGARPARGRRESGELQATAVVGLQNWKQQVVQRIKQAETQLTGRKFSSRWRQGLYELLELPESSRGAFVLQHGLVQHFRFAEYLRLSLGRRLERLVGVHRTGAALALPLVALLRAVHADACGAAEAGAWPTALAFGGCGLALAAAAGGAHAYSRRSGTGSHRAT